MFKYNTSLRAAFLNINLKALGNTEKHIKDAIIKSVTSTVGELTDKRGWSYNVSPKTAHAMRIQGNI